MIYQSTKLIEQTFTEHNLHCQAVERGELSIVQVGFNGKNARNVMMLFISHSDMNDIGVRIMALATVPEEKRGEILSFINDKNARFRYAKLVLTKAGEVNVEADVAGKTANVGEVCMEIFIRMVQIVDEIYPDLMKAVWS